MTLKKIKAPRLKPLFIKFYRVFENVQSREKIFKFRNKKWEALLNRLKKRKFYYAFYSHRLREKRRMPIFDHLGNTIIPRIVFRRLPKYKKRYLYNTRLAKKISLFYGDLTKKYMRKIVKKNIWKKKKK